MTSERRKKQEQGIDKYHSIYRELVFLAYAAIGYKNIDFNGFFREYVAAYEKMTEKELSEDLQKIDSPPSSTSIFCQAYFRPLKLP